MTPTPLPDRRDELRRRLREAGLVAIIRAPESTHLHALAEVLIEQGVSCIELTLTTPGGLEVLERLRARFGDEVLWGAGTVTRLEQAEAAVAAGAEFLVAPTTDDSVLDWCGQRGVPMIPGALTPTEIVRAWEGGATLVKVFPCDLVGGVGYIRAVRAPLPDVPLLPTGGIKLEDVASYLSEGCIAVGVGSPLMGDAWRDGADLSLLRERARCAVAAVRASAKAVV
jgi:2-dehydro-3-deoxyphosphogluconate aldolase / (4S)-4-hydroxy-2-oxoglutarate aldolase